MSAKSNDPAAQHLRSFTREKLYRAGVDLHDPHAAVEFVVHACRGEMAEVVHEVAPTASLIESLSNRKRSRLVLFGG